MLLEFAGAQFARGNRRSITYVPLDRRIRAARRIDGEEWVVEQKQREHQANRPSKKPDRLVSRWLGDIAHSLHITIDAAGADFAATQSRYSINPHNQNELRLAEFVKHRPQLSASVSSRFEITVETIWSDKFIQAWRARTGVAQQRAALLIFPGD